MEEIVQRTASAMVDRGTPFSGVLFAGLMIKNGKVCCPDAILSTDKLLTRCQSSAHLGKYAVGQDQQIRSSRKGVAPTARDVITGPKCQVL